MKTHRQLTGQNRAQTLQSKQRAQKLAELAQLAERGDAARLQRGEVQQLRLVLDADVTELLHIARVTFVATPRSHDPWVSIETRAARERQLLHLRQPGAHLPEVAHGLRTRGGLPATGEGAHQLQTFPR